MKLSKSSAQAVLAMAFLAEQPTGSVIQARQVGGHLGIPTDSALKILQVLARHGLLASQLVSILQDAKGGNQIASNSKVTDPAKG